MDLDRLISGLQRKEIAAFEKLYGMYADNICGAIHQIVKNSRDADEICQDVFVKVWNSPDGYSTSKGRFFTWLLNIARNAAIDRLRSKERKNEGRTISTGNMCDFDAYQSYDLDGRTDTIGLDRMLDGLAEKSRQVVILFYLRGYSQREISDRLNIPLGTVKTLNRNGILKLRGFVARESSGRAPKAVDGNR